MARVKALTQSMYYVLLSLEEERHGYEIMQYVDWLTEGRVKIGPGTLYTLLARFEEESLIRMVAEKDNKKTYRRTEKGKLALEAEMDRLRMMLSHGEGIKGGRADEFEDRT